MSSTKIRLLGLASIWPLLHIIVSLSFDTVTYRLGQEGNDALLAPFGVFESIVTAVTFVVSLGIWIYYLVNSGKNPTVDQSSRTKWILALIFLSTFSVPVYWWRHIRTLEPEEFRLFSNTKR